MSIPAPILAPILAPWIFFILSTIILILTPMLSRLSAKFEKHSQITSRSIHLLIVALVVYHIVGEAMRSSGIYVILFSVSGFMVAATMELMGHAIKVKNLPIIPIIIAFTMAMHGLFDGYAFRTAAMTSLWRNSQLAIEGQGWLSLNTSGVNLSLSSYSLAFSCILHRLPESLYLWRMINTKISKPMALLCLLTLGLSTFIGLIMSEDLIHSSRPIYLNLSYLQVFIAGAILYAATRDNLFDIKKSNPTSISTKHQI